MEPLKRREPKPLIETTILLMGNEPMCYKVKLKNRIVAVANRVILDDIEDGMDVYDCWQQMFMIEKWRSWKI